MASYNLIRPPLPSFKMFSRNKTFHVVESILNDVRKWLFRMDQCWSQYAHARYTFCSSSTINVFRTQSLLTRVRRFLLSKRYLLVGIGNTRIATAQHVFVNRERENWIVKLEETICCLFASSFAEGGK